MRIRTLILEEIDKFKQAAQDKALDNFDEFNDFNNLRDIDKLALLGGTNDPRLKNLDLGKIFKENGGTFGRFNVKVRIKSINEQMINHTFSKEFAGQVGYLNGYINYSDESGYVTVRFNNFLKNTDLKGGGSYIERPIFLLNMYPIDYNDIKSEFKDYDLRVEKDRQYFVDRMNDLGLDIENY